MNVAARETARLSGSEKTESGRRPVAYTPDWRIWFGLGLTGTWIVLAVVYIELTFGWRGFVHLSASDLGNFLEGAFAPLAFLWLVIGYFLQKKELEHNTEALRAQAFALEAQLQEIQRGAEQQTIQAEKMAASEMHARQEVFLTIARRVSAQLGTISGFLYLSSQGAGGGTGPVSPEEISRLFAQQAARDPELFSRLLLSLHTQSDEATSYDLFYGTETRARHTNNFIFTFERLMRRAEEVDPDFIIRDSLSATGHGLIYGIAKRHQSAAPEHLADPARTGKNINF
jgi:hypothetical protein